MSCRLLAGLLACIVAGPPAAAHPEIQIQIDKLTQRIAADPSNADLYMQRGDLHTIHQSWPLAMVDYDRARDLDPNLRFLDFSVGRMKDEAGQPKEALTLLNRFLAREQDNAEGLTLRGQVLVKLGDPLAAAADFSRAIERRARDGNLPPPELFIARSRALLADGPKHQKEALRGLEQGLELLSRPITLELEALEVELAMKRVDDALSRLDRLASASARPEPWLVRRGEILEKAGRLAESRQAYRAALEAIAALPPSRRNGGALAEMEQQARTALQRMPGNTGDRR